MRVRHLGRRHALATLAVALCASVLALGGAAVAAPDSKGTDYWLMFTENLNPPALSLFITSDVPTTGTVAVPGIGSATTFAVAAGGVTTVTLPMPADATVGSKGVHVTAANEVTVYGLSQAQFTTDAFLGLPTDVLGTEHIVLSYPNVNVVNGTQFGVVATENGTTVTITPSVTTGGRAAGVPYELTMNAGQTYQLRNTSFPGDLTGTVITSDKPVAVFGGHHCANVPAGVFACDHLVEQLPSTDTWGQSFVTVPLATRVGGDTFRFLASTDDTTVSVNGTTVATLDRGQVHEQIVAGAAVIQASNPILVAQHSNSSTFDGVTSDPFMMLIPPSEQFLAEYTITTPAAGIPTNFVNVVAPTAAVGSITLDGLPVPTGAFTPIGSSGFSGAQLSVTVGSHRLQGALPFGVFSYGFADFDSYGYPGGASFAPVAAVADVALAPKTATNVVGTQHCVTATVTDQNGSPLAGVRVDFTVGGANTATGFGFTDADGEAVFCYLGESTGDDTITASVGALQDTAAKKWTLEPAVATTLTLTPKTAENVVNTQHCVTALVKDQRSDPLPGAEVAFVVSGANTASGTRTTNGSGQAEFCYTGSSLGGDTITATSGTASDTASKTWIQEPARPHTLTLAPPTATNEVGTQHCVTATLRDQRGDPFPGASVAFAVTGTHTIGGTGTTNGSGQAQFCYTGTSPGPDTITATVGSLTATAAKTWTQPPSAEGTVYLVLDEETRGKGKPLWAAVRPGDKLTVASGQTGDEGWFAPTCIPRKWLGSGSSNECLEGAERATAIDNVTGRRGKGAIPKDSRLDKVPAVMPLRALGLTSLVGRDVCATVYDSDVSLNYDSTRFPFTSANLQGKTHGLVAFRVDAVTNAKASSSTLPEVTVTILDPSACGGWLLFNAPVPRSSSEPSDTRADKPAGVGSKGYLQLRTWPLRELFF